MKTLSTRLMLAFALTLVSFNMAVANSPPKSRRGAEATWSEDGLQKMMVKDLDIVYARPGASLAGYSKVLLKPVSVAFRRDWGNGSSARGARVQPADMQRIKDKVAVLMREEVTKQLAEGGYQLVDSAGEDVLEINLSVVDLYVNAPDLSSSSRVTTFAVSAGEMTLVADLRDSTSGDSVMRIYDHAKARESIRPQRITNVDNEFEARAAAKAWAKALRKELDLARRIGGKS